MTSEFAPVGRMNQDDSLINPGKDMAGKNPFQVGDYRYALNARIGSSRSDNFNDLETIKGTTEVTDYKVRSQTFSNSDFSSGLTAWSQISVVGGTAWTVFVGSVVIQPVGAEFVSDILYRSILPSGKRIGLRFAFDFAANSLAPFSAQLLFLNGTSIISTQNIISDSTDTTVSIAKYLNVELPDGCDGVGFQIYGIATLPVAVDINQFASYDWISGTRPVGTEKVVGKREDKENNVLYYHVYNSNNDHCIRFYSPSEGAIYELLKWSGLAYTTSSFISSALIDNYMGITDRVNYPRLIDVNTISDLFIILGAEFREYHVSFHRWAPVMPPILKGFYDSVTNNYKKFEKKVLQFAYRYVYAGRLKSRFSPISAVAQNFLSNSGNEITSIYVMTPGLLLDVPGAAVEFNYFNQNDEKFYDVVDSIEYAYREGAGDVWKMFKRYEVRASGNLSVSYDGNFNGAVIPTDDITQLFDTVPFLAGTIETIDNRFVFGDCLDEQETAPPLQVTDVSVASFESTQTLDEWWNAGNNVPANNQTFFPSLSAGDADELGNRNRICDTTFKGRGIYKFVLQWLHPSGWRSAGYTDDSFTVEIPEETGIIDKYYAIGFKFPSTFIPPDWAIAYQVMRTNCLNIDAFMFGAANAFTLLIDDPTQDTDQATVATSIIDRIRQRMENARLVHAETQRQNILRQFKNDGQIKIQDFNFITGTGTDSLNGQLKKNPFFRTLASNLRKTTTTSTIGDASRIYININNWYNSSKKNVGGTQNNPMNKLFYNYREGDRVRFLASTTASPASNQKTVYDLLIMDCTGRGLVVEKPDGILWLPGGTNTIASDYMIEVYTPKLPEQQDYIFYECGEIYPVLYPGTEQRDMSKRDWTYTDNTGITADTYGDFTVFHNRPLSYGDCHGVTKAFYYDIQTVPLNSTNTGTQAISSMTPDPEETFSNWDQCNGRPTFAYTDLPTVRFKPTQVRFGGQAVEESFINNINRFRDEDQKIYPSEYGRIRALVNTSNAQVESVGAILLAVGERETFSIYVNRTTFEDLSGRTSVALSDRILGSYNTLLGSHGTLNPESISVERGRVYFWDALDGTWVRYGRDGLTEISFYKMRTWFREIAQLLINEYGDVAPNVISEFDPYNEELLTRIDHSSLPETFRGYADYKGGVFSEEDTGWKSIYSYDPEMFGKINTQFVCFRGGSLLLTETNSTRSTFFGTKYDVKIEPVFNGEVPRLMKSHQFIAIISSHKWSVERFLSEYRGSKTIQQSSLTLDNFQEKEDGYYSEILNDVNTPVVSNPILNGDKMRSKALQALLVLDPAVVEESLLHYVVVGDIDSPKNA